METVIIVVVLSLTVLLILSGVKFSVTYTPKNKKTEE